MLLSSKNIMICAVVTLYFTIYAYTAPTINHGQPKSPAIQLAASASKISVYTDETSYATESIHEPAEIDFSFMRPSVFLPETISKSSPNVRTLPAVPGAIFMTLMGVFCILFFQERRTLVTVLAGIVILSQYGIKSLPKLTSRLTHGKIITGLPDGENSFGFHNRPSNHPAGRSDSIEFIGLLHRLATSTPDDVPLHYRKRGNSISASIVGKYLSPEKESVRTGATPFALTLLVNHVYPNSLIKHWIKRSKSIPVFSPAFMFDNLSRGPPPATSG